MRRLTIAAIAAAIATGGLAALAVSQEYTPANDPELAAVAAALAGTPHSLASAIAQVAVGGEVPIEAKFEGGDVTVAFNPQFLLDGLLAVEGEEVVLETLDPLKPATLRGTDHPEFLYLLMPVRIS